MPDIDEIVKLANQNEKYPVNENITTNDLEKIANRKEFKSKHFGRAETICCGATTITIILLLCIWIYFEVKEDADRPR